MSWWVAVLLGIVQGIFMFFPVSSTSHLALVQHWLISRGVEVPAPDSPEMILFDLMVHVGTLVSIAVVFRESLSRYINNSVRGFLNLIKGTSEYDNTGRLYVKLTLLGMLSVLVTGMIGFPLKALFESVFAQPLIISITLTITGILLYWTDVLPARKIGLRDIGIGIAIIIGIAQGLALLPGLSRSGTTIAFALFAGMQRRWAAEYSFFIAFPTILGASLLQTIEVIQLGGLYSLSITTIAIGFVVAAIVGIIALKLVLALLYRAEFRFFSYYVWMLAAVILYVTYKRVL
jgi:undecaprenyl-diphosphatase